MFSLGRTARPNSEDSKGVPDIPHFRLWNGRSQRILRRVVALLLLVTLLSQLSPTLVPTFILDRLARDPSCRVRRVVMTEDGRRHIWESPSAPLPINAPLAKRIEAWRASPIAGRRNWTEFNGESCDNESVHRNKNWVLSRESKEAWEGYDDAKNVEILREELIGVLEKAESEGRFAIDPTQEGIQKRGLDTFSRVIVTLRLLRSFGTVLPVEIFHFSSETPSDEQIRVFTSLNATTRTVHVGKKADEARSKSFHIKGAALVESEFQEFLYLDSDSIPIKDVTPLFDGPGYKDTGALFFPDFWRDSPENAIWSVLGVQCRDEWTQESGQMLINKAQHLDALLLVEYMLSRWEHFFRFSDGDKDLFRYAFLALRKRWAVPGRHLGSASWLNSEDLTTNRFCGHTMVQHDEFGEEMFVHANLIKRNAGSFAQGSTWGRTLRLSMDSTSTSLPNSTSIPHFATTADHLANADRQGNAILPAPPSVRRRAALERGLKTSFHDGYRQGAYTFCVDVEFDGNSTRKERIETGGNSSVVAVQNVCSSRVGLKEVVDWERGDGGLEMMLWEKDPDLRGFEERYFKAGGVPCSEGF